MNTDHSEFALHYVAHARRNRRPVTWFDVAQAYDAGLEHAVAVTPAKRKQIIRIFHALKVIRAARAHK